MKAWFFCWSLFVEMISWWGWRSIDTFDIIWLFAILDNEFYLISMNQLADTNLNRMNCLACFWFQPQFAYINCLLCRNWVKSQTLLESTYSVIFKIGEIKPSSFHLSMKIIRLPFAMTNQQMTLSRHIKNHH
mgnify:CR=1 FL=1